MRVPFGPLPLFILLAACAGEGKEESDVDGDGIEAPGDCDDNDPAVKPGAVEVCDGVDNDCDGEIDEGTGEQFYVDADGDGFGDDGSARVFLCALETGYVEEGGDCDDNDSGINPDATESCDAVDRNCDGSFNAGAPDVVEWYIDRDGDGFGAGPEYGGLKPVESCDPPGANYVSNGEDCDDTADFANPMGSESCNGIDDDCNGIIDDDPDDGLQLFVDADLDGFGDVNSPVFGCEATGLANNEDDCDDTNDEISPEAEDICNGGIDDDCDPTTDEDTLYGGTFYVDGDTDGYGDAVVVACEQPAGTSTDDGDCNDSDDAISPGEQEDCTATDRNCDGDPVDGAADAVTYYLDADGDTFGNATSVASCTVLTGYVERSGDCNDANDLINPDALELCNGGVDDDCDALTTDDDSPTAPAWYFDGDGDGFAGADSQVFACEAPLYALPTSDDCDDLDPYIYPGANDVCDGGVDNDCDPLTDEELVNRLYEDADFDGFGNNSVYELGCLPSGTLTNAIPVGDDCDDTDPNVNPIDTPDCTVEHCGTLASSETWRANVQHLVTCDVLVQGANTPTLTLEPGVEVLFEAGTEVRVGDTATGAIVVDASTPAVFTSAELVPANGDWDGLFIGDKQDGSSIRGLVIEYAGGTAGLEGAGLRLDLGDTDLEISELTVSRNAGDGVRVITGEPWIHDSVFTDNDRNGLYVKANQGLERLDDDGVPSFTGNVILGNGEYPVSIPGSHADEINYSVAVDPLAPDADGDGLPDELETQLGLNPALADSDGDGVLDADQYPMNVFLDPANPNGSEAVELLSGTMRTTGTWLQHDMPYYVPPSARIVVEDGPKAILTVADGVVAYFDLAAELLIGVGAQGALIVGDYPNPSSPEDVVYFLADPALSAGNLNWDGVTIGPGGSDSSIAGLVIEEGGGNFLGNLWIDRSAPSIAYSVFRYSDYSGIHVSGVGAAPRITNTDMVENDTYGLYVSNNSGIFREIVGGSFFNNSFVRNGTTSVALPPNFVGELDSSSTFADTDPTKRVRIHSGDVLDDATWQKLDADYEVLGPQGVDVGGPRDPILTIEAGNNIFMELGTFITAGGLTDGALIIDAEPPEPRVTFTSANPAPGPGDWYGLIIGDNGPLDSRLQSVLNGVNVEYATAAVVVAGCFDSPTKGPLVVSNMDIISSAGIGIDHQSGPLVIDTVNVPLPLEGYCFEQPPDPPPETCAAELLSATDLTCPGVDLGLLNAKSLSAVPPGVDFGFITFEGGNYDQDVSLPGLTSSYRVVGDINMYGPTDPTLTIEDGATVYFDPGVGIAIGGSDDGSLVIEGTGSQLLPYDLNQWDGIWLRGNCSADIQGGLIDGGGGNGTGAIWVDGCETGTVGDASFVNSFGTCDIYHEGALEPGFDITGALSAFVCAVP